MNILSDVIKYMEGKALVIIFNNYADMSPEGKVEILKSISAAEESASEQELKQVDVQLVEGTEERLKNAKRHISIKNWQDIRIEAKKPKETRDEESIKKEVARYKNSLGKKPISEENKKIVVDSLINLLPTYMRKYMSKLSLNEQHDFLIEYTLNL